MAENFDLIFGQNASQQYAWSDNDYQNGWGTVGNIPPTAAQFDALQRRADTKAQELNTRLVSVEQSIAGGGSQKREPDTEYTAGTILTYDDLPMNWVIECIVGGISSANDITLPSPIVEGARILDGTVTWALRKIATYGGIGYRQSSTACPTGSIAFSTALPAGWYLEATTGGITSANDLVITSPVIGDTVTDGTVVWTIRVVASTADIPAPVDISGKANVDLDNLSAAGEAKIQSVSPRYLTDSYYDATTGDWYRVYSDGWVEQGGIYTNTTNTDNVVINLLKPMADDKYNVSIARRGANAYIASQIAVNQIMVNANSPTYNRASTTSFYVNQFISYDPTYGFGDAVWKVEGQGAIS